MKIRRRGLKAWPALGIVFIQAILLAAHWFIYRTWIDFGFAQSPGHAAVLRALVIPLAVSFMAAALLGYRFSNPFIRAFYTLASVWLGVANYLFLASCLCWLAALAFRLAGVVWRPAIAAGLFELAAVVSIYGLLNARRVRLQRVTVRLENLPASWRGRTAVIASDVHLGNLNGLGFVRRIAGRIAALNPDIVFLPGDLFDGSGADPDRLVAPLKDLKPPLGIFYVTGNHEEFGHAEHYTTPIARAGIRVLSNEKAVVDGVAILGIPWGDLTYPIRVKATLDALHPDRAEPAILLLHSPTRLPTVEQAGVALQISGHTHDGQLFPFNWITRRVYGEFTHGLHRFGALTVYTSCGAGTWGPPMRVGTTPEIVELRFE
jgi:predicted MPP superfamily phosphohydrolase